MTATRELKFDYYKGFLIFGVLWGHLITTMLHGAQNTNFAHLFFRTYDMPFFMLISGYFLRTSMQHNTPIKLIGNKLSSIIFPAVLWSLLVTGGKSLFAFYFLCAIGCSAVIVIASSVLKNHILQLLSLLAAIVFFHIVPVNLCNLSYLFPFFVLGYYGKGILSKEQKHYKVITVVCSILFTIMLCFWTNDYTIWNTKGYVVGADFRTLIIILYRFFIALTGIVSIQWIMASVGNALPNISPKFSNFFLECGKETLSIYILQQIVIFNFGGWLMDKLCQSVGNNPLVFNMNFLGYVLAPLLSFILLYIFLQLIRFTKKLKFTRWIWGFKLFK